MRKYRRTFKLGEVHNGGTKEELMPAVSRHWNQTIVDEEEILVAFAFALRKHATTGSSVGLNLNRSIQKSVVSRPVFKGKMK